MHTQLRLLVLAGLLLPLAACPEDVVLDPCGDGVCAADEADVCPVDCQPDEPPQGPPDAAPAGPSCGNQLCEAGETPATCAIDCHCGNGLCDAAETPTSCPGDCHVPSCGDGVCEAGEPYSCSECSTVWRVENTSAFTIFYLYIKPCSSGSWGNDQLGASVLSPGYAVDFYGVPPGCYDFRATNSDGGYYWQSFGYTLTAGTTFTWTLS